MRFGLTVMVIGLVFCCPESSEINRAGRALIWAGLTLLALALALDWLG